MRTIQTLVILFLIFLASKSTFATKVPHLCPNHPICKIETRLINGDKSALFDIAPFLDSKKKVIESMGHHLFETIESNVAKRLIFDNTLFTQEEFMLNESTTAKQFTEFLNKNIDKIEYSALATSFLITPLEQRVIDFEIRALPETRKEELRQEYFDLLERYWVKENKIDTLIRQRNPIVLLLVASELNKKRDRLNHRIYLKENQFIHLLQHLTGTEIGIKKENGEVDWYSDENYSHTSKVNMLIYWSKYYSQYTWDKQQSAFVNPNEKVKPSENEVLLSQLKNVKMDTLTINKHAYKFVYLPQLGSVTVGTITLNNETKKSIDITGTNKIDISALEVGIYQVSISSCDFGGAIVLTIIE